MFEKGFYRASALTTQGTRGGDNSQEPGALERLFCFWLWFYCQLGSLPARSPPTPFCLDPSKSIMAELRLGHATNREGAKGPWWGTQRGGGNLGPVSSFLVGQMGNAGVRKGIFFFSLVSFFFVISQRSLRVFLIVDK